MDRLFKRGALFLLLFSTLWGSTSGKIAGTVLNEAGQPLIGVNVLVSGTTLGASTNEEGYYAILNVPPGTYTLRLSYIGYASVNLQQLEVSMNLTSYQDVTMTPEVLSAGEEVVVIAERPLLNQDEFSSKHIVTAEDMELQPVDDVISIAQNQAGVIGSNFRGGRSGEVLVVVDGIPVRDPSAAYTGDLGGFSLDIPKDAVQEMEVSLGGFSAEYGNVQSGVLNLAMKEGSRQFHGSVYATTTNFGTLNDALMPKDDWWLDAKFQHKLENNLRFNLSGPLLPAMTFSLSGELFERSQGYFLNQEQTDLSLQGKIAWRLGDNLKLAVGGNYTFKEWDYFYFQAAKYGFGENFQSDLYEFVDELSSDNDTLTRYIYVEDPENYSLNIDSLIIPYTIALNDSDTVAVNYHRNVYLDAPVNHLTSRRKESATLYGILTYTLSPRTFMEIRAQVYNSNYINGMRDYQDRDNDGDTDEFLQWDAALDGPRPEKLVREYEFWWLSGDDSEFRDQFVTSTLLKYDITSQLNRSHMLKAGFQLNMNTTDVTNITWSSVSEETGFALNTLRKDIWKLSDSDFGAYVQDKMEFRDDMVALVGLRIDRFDPNGGGDPLLYPSDMSNPLAGYDEDGFAVFNEPAEAEVSWQISPRLGMSHPISDRDILFFTYGHYFQRPDGRYLFSNFQYQSLTKVGNWVGNPGLKPEKTVAYDLSFEHLFTRTLKMSLTGYFKDVTDLVNNEKWVFPDGTEVNQYVNGDYANIKGVELAVKRVREGAWSLDGNVSYSIAKGRNSSTGSVKLYPYDRKMYYLDFDRRISANVNLGLYSNNGLPFLSALTAGWIANFQYEFGTGKPFSTYGEQGAYNDRRLPDYHDLDMRISRLFSLGETRMTLILDVFNVLDNDLHYSVYTKYYDETGLPDIIYKEALSDLEIRTPLVYPSPRQYKVGLSFNF